MMLKMMGDYREMAIVSDLNSFWILEEKGKTDHSALLLFPVLAK